MNLSYKYKQNAPFKKIDKKILISPGFLLNETASFIWENCDGNKTAKQIIEKFLLKYGSQNYESKERTSHAKEIIERLVELKVLK